MSAKAAAPQRGALEARYIEAFEQMYGARRNGEPDFLNALRHQAISSFRRQGFPSRKNEAWKYTSMAPIVRAPLALPGCDAATGPVQGIAGLEAYVGVFIDGTFRADLSRLEDLPQGVTVDSLSRAPENLLQAHLARQADVDQDAFVALNTAFLHDGAFVHVRDNVTLEKPIHLIQVATGTKATLAQPRSLILAGTHARFSLVDTIKTQLTTPSLVNNVSEVNVGEGAHVSRFEIQDLPAHVSLVSAVDTYQHASSCLRNVCFTFGGQVVRNNLSMLPDAENCETYLNGLFVVRGTSHVDTHTLVDHAKPRCFSSENYRGILDERATGVFNGKVLVRQDAQQINAYQTNKSIVLADTARMYAKPELEIYADDVKCSHGATTGQLDADALFYLRARGLPLAQARRLLLEAFAGDILSDIPFEPLHALLSARIAQNLAR